MSFKINSLGARLVKARAICAAEQIVTLLVLLAILSAVSYPMYFGEASIYLVILLAIKSIMAFVLLFDLSILVRRLFEKVVSK